MELPASLLCFYVSTLRNVTQGSSKSDGLLSPFATVRAKCAMPPPGIVTPALISAIRGQPYLPRGCWYFVAGVALNALNLSAEIPTVFNHAIENGAGSSDTKPGHAEKLEIARKMRESLVKAAAICGLPKVSYRQRQNLLPS